MAGRTLPRAGPPEPRPDTLDDVFHRRSRPGLLPLPARRALLTPLLPRLGGALFICLVVTPGSRRFTLTAFPVTRHDIVTRSF